MLFLITENDFWTPKTARVFKTGTNLVLQNCLAVFWGKKN